MLSAQGQSICGLQIGDGISQLKKLGKTVAQDTYKSFLVQKWTLPDGNDLSATTDATHKIVYLESDWNGGDESTCSDLPWLKFGKTTLADIRKRFGSNGFMFKERGGMAEFSSIRQNRLRLQTEC